MRKLALLVGLVAASALVSTACVTKIDTNPPGTGANGGTGGTGGGGGTGGTDSGVYSELFGSGSRLQATVLDGGDGAEVLHGFHDTVLDQGCMIVQLSDDSVRCAPNYAISLSYKDGACTEPVIVLNECHEAPPAYISSYVSPTCASEISHREVHEVGAVAAPTEIYKPDGDGGCVQDLAFDPMTQTVHDVTPADTSIFAEVTIAKVEADGGLGQRVATAEGGAFQVLGAYNIARDEACAPTDIGAESLCLGHNIAYSRIGHSTSDACDDQDVGSVSTPEECGEPQGVVKVTPGADACAAETSTLHALGDVVDATAVYEGDDTMCVLTDDTDRRYYAIGGEAMAGDVPVLGTTTVGTGRLTHTDAATPDGAPVRTIGFNSFMDTERNEACTAAETADGTRCMPSASMFTSEGTTYYSDDQCTVQVIPHTAGQCAAEPPTYVGFRAEATDLCGTPIESIHPRGAEHTGAVYQTVGMGNACTQGTYEGVDFYEIDAAIPFTDFAELTMTNRAAE